MLAQINDLKVTEAHFVSAFKKNYYRVGEVLVPSIENKLSVLRGEFKTYILAEYAKDVGISDDIESLKEFGLLTRKVYVEEYLEREVLDEVIVTERDLRDLFIRFNTTLRASHLYAENADEAGELMLRLENGESFEQIAFDTFENGYLAQNGGDIGEFTADEMDIAFENAAFNLEVGEISEPVKTRQGYSIIKLTDRTTIPLLTEYQYQTQKNNFIALADKRLKEIATRKHIEETVSSLNIDKDLLSEIWDTHTNFNNGSIYHNYENQTLNLAVNVDASTLASKNGFEFTLGDLRNEGFYSDASNLNRIVDYNSFEEFVKGIIYRTYLVQEFKNSTHINDPSVEASIDQSFYSYLNNRVTRYLKENIVLEEAELIEEFEANKEMYDFPLMMNVGRLVVESEEKAELVLSELEKGLDWNQAVKQFTTVNRDLMVDGIMGLQPIQNYGSYAYDLNEAYESDIVGPLAFQPNQFVIFKVLETQEPREASFDEVRDLVIQITTDKKVTLMELEVIAETMDRHNAILDEEKLKSITIEL